MSVWNRARSAARWIALAAAVLSSVGGNAQPAFAAAATPMVEAAVGLPGAGAPSGTTFDLSVVGYQAAEFFLSGSAASYHNATGLPFLADGLWTIEADAATAAYKTPVRACSPHFVPA